MYCGLINRWFYEKWIIHAACSLCKWIAYHGQLTGQNVLWYVILHDRSSFFGTIQYNLSVKKKQFGMLCVFTHICCVCAHPYLCTCICGYVIRFICMRLCRWLHVSPCVCLRLIWWWEIQSDPAVESTLRRSISKAGDIYSSSERTLFTAQTKGRRNMPALWTHFRSSHLCRRGAVSEESRKMTKLTKTLKVKADPCEIMHVIYS